MKCKTKQDDRSSNSRHFSGGLQAFGLAFFVERFLLTVILYISITFLYLVEMAKGFDMCPKRKNPHTKKNLQMAQHYSLLVCLFMFRNMWVMSRISYGFPNLRSSSPGPSTIQSKSGTLRCVYMYNWETSSILLPKHSVIFSFYEKGPWKCVLTQNWFLYWPSFRYRSWKNEKTLVV
jgi:hypothetical protein